MTPDITTNKITAATSTTAAAAATAAMVATRTSATGRTLKATKSAAAPTPPPPPLSLSTTTLPSSSTSSTSIMKRHLLTVEKLRNRVRQILKSVINLHIDILVIESNVNQLIDDVKELNADLMEVQRLDNLIQTLRDYNGPTICYEWPFPLVYQGTIDEADLAQTLNTSELFASSK